MRQQHRCDDGSGTFYVEQTIDGEVDPQTATDIEGTWRLDLSDALGDYRDATGSGTYESQRSDGSFTVVLEGTLERG